MRPARSRSREPSGTSASLCILVRPCRSREPSGTFASLCILVHPCRSREPSGTSASLCILVRPCRSREPSGTSASLCILVHLCRSREPSGTFASLCILVRPCRSREPSGTSASLYILVRPCRSRGPSGSLRRATLHPNDADIFRTTGLRARRNPHRSRISVLWSNPTKREFQDQAMNGHLHRQPTGSEARRTGFLCNHGVDLPHPDYHARGERLARSEHTRARVDAG